MIDATTATQKQCSKCGVTQPLTEFYLSGTPSGGRRGDCKTCQAAYTRRHALWRRFGITVEQFDELLASQGGGCALCGTSEAKGRWGTHLFVDHCHETGRVRGLLCHRCNTALGVFGDNRAGFLRVLAYLDGEGATNE